MTAFLGAVRFELSFYARRISTWVFFGVFLLAGFLAMSLFGGAFPGGSAAIAGTDGNVAVNSPHVLTSLTLFFWLYGLLVAAAIGGHAGYRDFGDRTFPIVFATPVTRATYLGSRWVAVVTVNLLVLSGATIGLWIGSISPWVVPERFGENRVAHYVWPFVLVHVPNVLLTTAVFLVVAAWTRKKLPHYLGGAGMLLAYLVASELLGDLGTKAWGVLADPFGIAPFEVLTEYWTTVERNTRLVPLAGDLLWNRVLWGSVALSIFAFGTLRLSLGWRDGGGRRGARARAVAAGASGAAPAAAAPLAVPATRRRFDLRTTWRQLRAATERAFGEVVVNPFFFVLLAIAVAVFAFTARDAQMTLDGTPTWPRTWKMIEVVRSTFSLFVTVLVTLFAGELVWRERDVRSHQMIGAKPCPDWILPVSKLGALVGMLLLVHAAAFAAGVVAQALLGYFDFEWLVYLQSLFGLSVVDYVVLAVAALAIHALAAHKYAGHGIFLATAVAMPLVLPLFGVDHALLRYGSDLGTPYSDMNRYGWFLGPFVWFKVYWGGIAVLLAGLSWLFWSRGVDRGFGYRARVAWTRLRAPAVAVFLVGASVAAGAGGYVYYNTNVLNPYRDSDADERRRARYELEYRRYLDAPQPTIADVSLEVDFFPERGDATVRGRYVAVNRTDAPLSTVHVRTPPGAVVRRMAFDGGQRLDHEDEDLGYRIYELERPVEPGEATGLHFDLAYLKEGFAHRVERNVVENGSFIDGGWLPAFGYDPRGELVLDRMRAKHDLGTRRRRPDLDDEAARERNYIARDAHWVRFEAVVGTSSDQIALAPGDRVEEWTDGDRRYFRYAMDAPVLKFFAFLSARYEVAQDTWGDVPIEVYHHADHDYNLDRMIAAAKASLAYGTEAFSPYPHRAVRIVEFPRYAAMAQSYPTLIPYSEAIGFISRVRAGDIDYPFYVTAHEVAHQWWAHQVVGGDVQGATVLSETLAQYTALMVMRREFGDGMIRDFLRYELDQYLRGRALERREEMPLYRVEDQAHIHYNKGALVLYALADVVGEDAVNRALRGFVERWAFRGPPYPTTRDLTEALRAEVPDELDAWFTDLFEHITLYENRAVSAVAAANGDGTYEVRLEVAAAKRRADGYGAETEVPLDDPIDVAVFDADGEPLAIERRRLGSGTTEIVWTVSERPARAGIDPYHKLIDRHPDDNEIDVAIRGR